MTRHATGRIFRVMRFKSPVIHRSPLYRAKSAYAGMKKRCLNANGRSPAYAKVELRMTLKEWLAWATPRYLAFNKKYPKASPNASRIGDTGHYEIGNIQILPQKRNREVQNYRCRRVANEKLCTRCQQVLSANAFTRKSSAHDGLDYWCRACKN